MSVQPERQACCNGRQAVSRRVTGPGPVTDARQVERRLGQFHVGPPERRSLPLNDGLPGHPSVLVIKHPYVALGVVALGHQVIFSRRAKRAGLWLPASHSGINDPGDRHTVRRLGKSHLEHALHCFVAFSQ